jgi:hypothetical protein
MPAGDHKPLSMPVNDAKVARRRANYKGANDEPIKAAK